MKIILRRADCFIEGQQYTCNGRYSECCTGIWHHALVLMSHKTMPVKVISAAMASASQLGLFLLAQVFSQAFCLVNDSNILAIYHVFKFCCLKYHGLFNIYRVAVLHEKAFACCLLCEISHFLCIPSFKKTNDQGICVICHNLLHNIILLTPLYET